ncbi:MAG: hypothetical protein KY475_13595 [Planctomycetes bacterium]|nr:hypothetical protein [Planctomycetota bacterium]
MPVSLNCPAGHRLTVSRRHAGKMVRCPRCQQKVRIPSAETLERKLREKQLRSASSAAPAPRREHPSGVEAVTSPPVAASERRRAATESRPSPPPPKSRPRPAPPPKAKGAPVIVEERGLKELPLNEPAPPASPEAPPSLGAEIPVAEAPPEAPPVEVGTSSSASAAVRGYEPEPERRWTCYLLGMSLAVLGVFGALPAVLEIADYLQSDQTIPVARWAWLALLAAAVQLAYATYAVQLPDWSTAWMVTFVGAGMAALYAGLLGLTLLAGAESRVVALLELEDQLAQGKAARWCFVMIGALGIYAYLGGRSALRWRHAFNLTRPVKERTV